MKETIHTYFNKYVPFTNEEIDEIYSHMILKKIDKKEFLVQEGEICKYQFFILTGLTRSFYTDEKGHEVILQFAIEKWWVTSIESFLRENPSMHSIQALENTTVLMINKEALEQLYVKFPKLDRVFRVMWENMLIALQRRYGYYMKRNSKEKYETLVRFIPDLVQRVPQYMIASYLEVTPEYLSELRKQK